MIRHDLTQWPLVLSVMRGPMSLADQLGFFADWTTWLDRGERFATLRVCDKSDSRAVGAIC